MLIVWVYLELLSLAGFRREVERMGETYIKLSCVTLFSVSSHEPKTRDQQGSRPNGLFVWMASHDLEHTMDQNQRSSNSSCSGIVSPTLRKHSRNSNSLKEEKGEKPLWVLKTLRIEIDDPDETARSSIWATLGIKPGDPGTFKTFPSRSRARARDQMLLSFCRRTQQRYHARNRSMRALDFIPAVYPIVLVLSSLHASRVLRHVKRLTRSFLYSIAT